MFGWCRRVYISRPLAAALGWDIEFEWLSGEQRTSPKISAFVSQPQCYAGFAVFRIRCKLTRTELRSRRLSECVRTCVISGSVQVPRFASTCMRTPGPCEFLRLDGWWSFLLRARPFARQAYPKRMRSIVCHALNSRSSVG